VMQTEHTYQETLEAWRTSCPKLTVWEEANERGLLAFEARDGRALARPSPAGLRLLGERRPRALKTPAAHDSDE
jgi:hypothetical protein